MGKLQNGLSVSPVLFSALRLGRIKGKKVKRELGFFEIEAGRALVLLSP